MYPDEKVIKDAALEAEKARLKNATKRKNVLGILGVTSFPTVALSVLGAEWYHLSTAFAIMSCFAIPVATVGVLVAAIEYFEWGNKG